MSKILKLQTILLILAVCVFSCSNKMNLDEGLEEELVAKFYVRDASDKCGRFVLFCDLGSPYHFHGCFVYPENLPKKYQKQGLHVIVTHRYTGEFSGYSDENSCICCHPIIKIIKIKEI